MEGNVHNYIYRVHLSKATSLRMLVYTYLCMYSALLNVGYLYTTYMYTRRTYKGWVAILSDPED